MILTPATLWLILGVVLVALEALGLPGVGMLFAGLAALTVGVLLSLGLIEAEASLLQFIVFFAATALWAVLLWKPLQKFRLGRGAQHYSNIVGETAQVGAKGIGKEGGEVTWSGTIMQARLLPDVDVETLPQGASVVIVEVRGATLMVKPKT